METKPLKDVDRRFGRISGTLALVYIAVFAKFGLWQVLTERCCGAVETAGVGTAIALIVMGMVLIQIFGNGFVYLYCHFRPSDPSRAQEERLGTVPAESLRLQRAGRPVPQGAE